MAKVTDIWIHVESNGQKIDFETPVNVTKEGVFTTTLPTNAVEQIQKYGLVLRNNRIGNPGYFEAKTLDELKASIKATCNEALSRELVEEKLVIKYEICTKCNYLVDDNGDFVPNGTWLTNLPENGLTDKWKNGNGNTSMQSHTPSISVWAHVFHKRKYVYKSGKEQIVLENYHPNEKPGERTAIDWINSVMYTAPTRLTKNSFVISEKERDREFRMLPEVDATEKNAQFFVTMLKLIFKMNELFGNFNKPETLLGYIQNNAVKELIR